jgi:L-2-hydroxyglutarate oxidase LhgO
MDVNITIIGAGVVGLAIASRLSKKWDNVFVVERNKLFGQETSSRNSEVIHSGIYYAKDSLKAKLCVRGRKLLYETCKNHDILFNNCGKLIVATKQSEIAELQKLKQKAINNNVHDLVLMEKNEVLELEPNVNAIQALFSPSTGIIDTHGLMKFLETSAINNGVDFAYRTNLNKIEKTEGGYKLTVKDADGQNYVFTSSRVVNCAGLESDLVATMLGINDESHRIYFCKGEYFKINPPKNKMVSRLIYPVPGDKMVGLGIHSTIDLSGGLKLGPSAFYLDRNIYDYSVNTENKDAFFRAAKMFLPFLEPQDLSPEMAGIRPKIQAPDADPRDFIIREEGEKGLPGFINLIGIESPGLTSCMAIAEYVDELL